MDFRLPELGEGVYESELVGWHVNPGDTVHPGQNLMEVLTDKASMEVASPFAGSITAMRAKPGDMMKVGDVVLEFQPAGAAVVATAAASSASQPERAGGAVNGSQGERVVATSSVGTRAAPSVRYLARKLGVDLSTLKGSGPEGRILIDDLAAKVKKEAGSPQSADRDEHPELGVAGTRMPMQGLRRKIAQLMATSKRTIPHYSYVDELDATALVRLREALKEDFAATGVKLTYLAFAVQAVVGALKEVPIVNASLTENEDEIVLHDHYHVGIAVSTPAGLIVPVIHDADKLDLVQIAGAIDRLSTQAREGKIRLEDLRGATFTITSIGNIGGLFATPIISPPQVGILGLGKIVRRPVYDEAGAVQPADMVYLSFSFDHRVVDGAVGAAFGNAVLSRLRQPERMLLKLW